MTKSDKKLDWGTARVEVTALMPEIDVLLADNQTRTNIFNSFKAKGRISCGFSTFCRWIDRLSDEHPLPVKEPQAPSVKPKDAPPVTTSKKTPSPTPKEKKAGLKRIRTELKKFEN